MNRVSQPHGGDYLRYEVHRKDMSYTKPRGVEHGSRYGLANKLDPPFSRAKLVRVYMMGLYIYNYVYIYEIFIYIYMGNYVCIYIYIMGLRRSYGDELTIL